MGDSLLRPLTPAKVPMIVQPVDRKGFNGRLTSPPSHTKEAIMKTCPNCDKEVSMGDSLLRPLTLRFLQAQEDSS